MKRILALVMALVMALSLGTAAMAAEITTDGGTDSGDVVVSVQPFNQSVFSVTIVWDNLSNFTYKYEGWDDKDFVYTGGWLQEDGRTTAADRTVGVSVTNNSNVAISVTATFAEEATEAVAEGVTATLSNNTFDLAAKGVDGEFNVTVSGEPRDNNVQKSIQVGTITVKIAEKNA